MWNSLLAAGILLGASGKAATAPQPAWTRQLGSYRLVKWERIPRSETEADVCSCLLIRDRRGREVARIRGHFVEVESRADLDADGSPDLVVEAGETGAHGPVRYYVFSLGRRPRCLLAYNKNNIDDDARLPDLGVKDLDGDGRMELISWYDGFAYWDRGGRNWFCSFGGAARLPIVLGLRGGRFVEVTSHYQAWLRRRLESARKRLREELTQAHGEPLRPDAAQPMIECYAMALLLDGRTAAQHLVARIAPATEAARFRKIEPLVYQIVRERRKRYAYPAAYGRMTRFPGYGRVYE